MVIRMSEEYETLKKNLAQAEEILFLFEVKSKLDELPRILKKPILPFLERPIPGIIRDFLSEKGDRAINAIKPLMLVFLASCLEDYLKRGGGKGELYDMIKSWRQRVDERLTDRIHDVRKKRNKIAHGEVVEIDVNELRGMIADIKKYAEKIEEM